MKTFTVKEEGKLKDFTDNNYAQGSFYWNSLMKKSDIKVNGKKVGKNVDLHKGDVVSYYLTPVQESKNAFSVIYEDENVIVTDKESGVNSEAVFSGLKESREDVRFLHRLDRNTQGLMIFAKNEDVENEILYLFREKKVEKIYNALIVGKPEKDCDKMVAYLKKDEKNALVYVYGDEVKGSEKIITEYKVLDYEDGISKVEITLHTGKTHQIRAHFAYIGCPVLGDTKYGNKEENEKHNATRQRLVAKKLTLFTSGVLAYLSGKTFESGFSV